MEKFVIEGGKKIDGAIFASCAKNAVLPIMAASILFKEEIILESCPKIDDVFSMIKVLESIGVQCFFENESLHINAKNATKHCISKKMATKLRASIFCMGSILSRFKKANISLPGGCKIGERPVDLHLFALNEMGAEIFQKNCRIISKQATLHAASFTLPFQSVGATINAITAAILTKGKTIIKNVACEPEIADLCDFLNKGGAKIQGIGSKTIIIHGTEKLHSVSHKAIPDRIEIGSMLVLAAATGGKIVCKNCMPSHLEATLKVLEKCGCSIFVEKNEIILERKNELLPFGKIETQPHPGFPTDLQSQFLALGVLACGESEIHEKIFESRFQIASELEKMGAKTKIENKSIKIFGNNNLHAEKLVACDLRGAMAIIIACVATNGKSEIENIFHIDRGYEKIEEKLQKIGVAIKRVKC